MHSARISIQKGRELRVGRRQGDFHRVLHMPLSLSPLGAELAKGVDNDTEDDVQQHSDWRHWAQWGDGGWGDGGVAGWGYWGYLRARVELWGYL